MASAERTLLRIAVGPVPPIRDYALIGDAHGAALVSRTGTIDWCAFPHIDSPPFLLRLLDAVQGGFFYLGPVAEGSVTRRYRPNSNVLETTFHTPSGDAVLRDAMDVAPRRMHRVGDPPTRRHRILRTLSVESGSVEAYLLLRVTPDYARRQTRGRIGTDGRSATFAWEGGVVRLTASVGLEVQGETAFARTFLNAGETLTAVLGEPEEVAWPPTTVVRRLDRVDRYWRAWAARSRYRGPYRKAVMRSALVLKLLTHAPSGAIVAAPTTSLPEVRRGSRNWDYRYCWLRDATFTLHALELLGYFDEAHDFMHWIERVWENGADLQIMYGVNGESELPERELEHLAGYEGARPVRVGNAAYIQRQHDVFGEVVDSAYLFFHELHGAGRYGEALQGEPWRLLRSLVDYVARHWREPDHGIWEMRGRPRQFVHSKILCWVALDRGIQLAEAYRLPAPLRAWRRERSILRRTILHRGYSKRLRAFTQTLDGEELDASLLAIPVVGFLPGDDPRVRSTVDAIREHLGSPEGFLWRYRTPDALDGTEGAFLVCSFWLVNALILGGRVEEGRALFEQTLSRANDVGLFSEEIDPATGAFLGNFPQGFTHIAVIRSALFLDAASPGGVRPDPECPFG